MTLVYLSANRIEGLSTDTKPTNVPAGSRFYETDINYGEWFFDGTSWIQRLSIESDTFYDNFSSATFNFNTDGTSSPNGKWTNKFLSGGNAGVRVSSGGMLNGVNVMYLTPQASTSPGLTYSAQVYTVNTFQDFELTCKIRTIAQLRTGSAPNNWETAWLFWRSGSNAPGTQILYYFLIKISGSEFGKADNKEGSINNQILVTPGSPSATLGQWYAVKVRVVGNHHQVWVDTTGAGTAYSLIIDYIDSDVTATPAPSRQLQKGGNISLYTEDGNVEFSNVRIVPLYPKSIIDYEQTAHNTVPLPSANRKFGAWYASGSTLADGLINGLVTNLGASNAQVIDDLGVHWSYTTGASTGNQSGLSTTAAIFRRSHNPVVRAKILTPVTLANSMFWIGFSSSSTIANSTDPLNTFHGMLVGYRAGATTWQILGNNAQATDTLTTEGLTVTASKWVNVYLELQSASQCIIQLNNRTPVVIATTTSKPSVSTSMYLHCLLTTTTTSARIFTLDHIDLEISPGSDQ
jgi:hypothetical protein